MWGHAPAARALATLAPRRRRPRPSAAEARSARGRRRAARQPLSIAHRRAGDARRGGTRAADSRPPAAPSAAPRQRAPPGEPTPRAPRQRAAQLRARAQLRHRCPLGADRRFPCQSSGVGAFFTVSRSTRAVLSRWLLVGFFFLGFSRPGDQVPAACAFTLYSRLLYVFNFLCD